MIFSELKECMPACPDSVVVKFLGPLSKAMTDWGIITPVRVAAFLAQLSHESSNLTRLEENLNYSAQGLLKTFPRYFTQETVAQYSHQPEKIADHVYANRGGNGDEASGDGWKFRGRGPIQTTLKDNYIAVGKALQYDFVSNPEMLLLAGAGSQSAAWYWNIHGLNELADQNTIESFTHITKKINTAMDGLDNRLIAWERCKKALHV